VIIYEQKTYYKHVFTSYVKCDRLMNHLSESFKFENHRDKLVITMCGWIRMYLMNNLQHIREKCKIIPIELCLIS